MKRPFSEPTLTSIASDERHFSLPALITLMRAILAKDATFRLRAKGWSMAPFVCDGDVVSISPLPSEPLGLGAVAAFVHPETGKLLIHRVVGRRAGTYLMRGDNVAGGTDGWIPAASVLGHLTRLEREGRVVGLGLGRERRLIALLSRAGLLPRIGLSCGRLLKPILEGRLR